MVSYKRRALGRLMFRALDDRGATAVEYGLMVTLIALVIIASVLAFGGSVKGLFVMITGTAPFN